MDTDNLEVMLRISADNLADKLEEELPFMVPTIKEQAQLAYDSFIFHLDRKNLKQAQAECYLVYDLITQNSL
jgi:hypothetical protein